MVKKNAIDGTPNYWVFVLANQNQRNSHYNSQVIFDAQLRRKTWGLKVSSKNFKSMQKGDIAVLYIGFPYCAFAGCAVLNEAPRLFSKAEQNRLIDKKYRRKPKSGVKLKNLRRFNVQVPAPLAAPELKFIKNRKNWGAHLRGSAVKIKEADYSAIIAMACMLNPPLKKILKGQAKQRKPGIAGIAHITLH